MFPETLIICINTHGIVLTDIENNISKPILQKMTHPVNMYKINATTYGVPFISNLNNTEQICSQLNQTSNKLNLNILTPQEVSLILKKQCEILNRENTESIIKDSNKSKPLNLYANYSDFMFNIVETKPHEEYVEKLFICFDDEKMKELNIDEEEFDYFNTIRLLNLDNADLFELIQQLGFNQTQISLTDLIDVLYNMTEMKNLIIIDMTCSNTEDDKRNNSRIRRELIKQGLY
jgi:hypothetical protein